VPEIVPPERRNPSLLAALSGAIDGFQDQLLGALRVYAPTSTGAFSIRCRRRSHPHECNSPGWMNGAASALLQAQKAPALTDEVTGYGQPLRR